MNALLVAKVNNFLLRQRRVVLNLVGGGDNGGLRQELLEVLDAVVGDTNGLDLAGADELLHALPGGDVGVAVVNVARPIWELGEDGMIACTKSVNIYPFDRSYLGPLRWDRCTHTFWVHGQRPVHQVQVDVIETKVLETLLDTLLDARVI